MFNHEAHEEYEGILGFLSFELVWNFSFIFFLLRAMCPIAAYYSGKFCVCQTELVRS